MYSERAWRNIDSKRPSKHRSHKPCTIATPFDISSPWNSSVYVHPYIHKRTDWRACMDKYRQQTA